MLKKNNIFQVLSLSYPILTHIAISLNEFKLALLMLGIIAGLFILNRSKQPEKKSNFFFNLALWIGLIIFAVYIVFVDEIYVALYLPPVLILSFFIFTFAKTLLPGQEALLTKIARVIFHDDGPETAIYTRQVTWLWACFLALLLVQTIAISLFAPIEVWSLFTNILNYVFMGLLFIIEYIYRQFRFGYQHSIFYYLRGLSRVSLKQFQ
jgi:uncharacterized membrane protein